MDKIKDSIKEYEHLKIEGRKLKMRMDEIKEVISGYIIENYKEDEIPLEHGKIIVRHRPIWAFSEHTERRKEELEALEKEEIATGVAVDNGVDYIEYRSYKK